jgi:polysaccharide biosynthesis protein PslH
VAAARAVVAPLLIARGIQNKVLEGLAMGKPVFASTEVCRTFGSEQPRGVIRCDSVDQYCKALASPEAYDIRRATRTRFSWNANLTGLANEIRDLTGAHRGSLATVACR